MSRVYVGTTLGAPALPHTMTESAEAARAAVRGYAVKKQADRLVTAKHPRPERKVEHPVPANAKRLAAMAAELGYEVSTAHGFSTMNAGQANERKVPAVQVAGKSQRHRLGFRAVWVNGKAAHGILYEPGGPRSGTPVGVTGVMKRVGL